MRVLVCGGAGYIGSHVVYELIRNNNEVIVLDDLSTGNKDMVHNDAIFYRGSILDSLILNKIFKEHNIDIVMHFAAKVVVSESIKYPEEYNKTNVLGTKVLLDAMKDNDVNKIIFSSTAAVYGEPKSPICSEETKTLPINPYGKSKLEAEKLIQEYSNKYNIKYLIFRYFNVAGADESLELGLKKENITHLIPIVVETSIGIRKKVNIYGNDYNTKDGTWVRKGRMDG